MEIFRLFGSIFVNTDAADNSMQKTEKKADSIASKLGSGIKTAAKWGAGIVAAAGVVGGAMIASAKETAANMDVIDKASQRMEMDAESYQKLAYAADLCGVSTSQLESASKKLKQNMGDDADLVQYLEELASMEDINARNERASELFGAAVAQNLIPMLNAGGEGIRGMMSEAQELGIVMSNDVVKAGADTNDAFSKFNDVVSSVKNSIGAALMPVIIELLNWVVAHGPEIQQAVGNIVNFIVGAIDEIKPIIQGLIPIIERVFAILEPLWNNFVKPILMGIIDFLGGVFTGDFEKIFSGLAKIVETIFGAIVELVKLPINNMIQLVNGFIDGLNNIQIPDWVPVVGGKGLSIKSIPMLFAGGITETPGRVLVGEKGPEFLDLPAGARVTPLDYQASGLTKQDIYEVLFEILSGGFLRVLIEIAEDKRRMFDVMAEEDAEWKEAHDGVSRFA